MTPSKIPVKDQYLSCRFSTAPMMDWTDSAAKTITYAAVGAKIVHGRSRFLSLPVARLRCITPLSAAPGSLFPAGSSKAFPILRHRGLSVAATYPAFQSGDAPGADRGYLGV